jgi:hypothetical protein
MDQVRAAAVELATEIAKSGPLAIIGTRETLRRYFADEVARATRVMGDGLNRGGALNRIANDQGLNPLKASTSPHAAGQWYGR